MILLFNFLKDSNKFIICVNLHLSGDPQAHVARITHMKKLIGRIEAVFMKTHHVLNSPKAIL